MNAEGYVKYVKEREVQTKRGPAKTYAILLDNGEWYNCNFKKPSVSQGDAVVLDYEVGPYGHEVKKVTPKAATGGATGAPVEPVKGPKRKAFPLAEDDPDISMIRRSAAHLVATLYKGRFDDTGVDTVQLQLKMLEEAMEIWEPYFSGIPSAQLESVITNEDFEDD